MENPTATTATSDTTGRSRVVMILVALGTAALITLGVLALTGGQDDEISIGDIESTTSTSTTTTITSTTIALAPTTVPPTTAATTAAPTTAAPTTTSSTTTTAPVNKVAAARKVKAPPAAPPAPAAVTPAGWINIPNMDLSVQMFNWDAYKGLSALDYGPGHWIGTAEPGQDGNMVIGAHRTSKNHEFRYIDTLQVGDEIKVENESGQAFTYVVTDPPLVIQPTDTWILDNRGKPTITLFACHPLGSTRQRIVVFGDLKQ